jgi:hypothetical protein
MENSALLFTSHRCRILRKASKPTPACDPTVHCPALFQGRDSGHFHGYTKQPPLPERLYATEKTSAESKERAETDQISHGANIADGSVQG